MTSVTLWNVMSFRSNNSNNNNKNSSQNGLCSLYSRLIQNICSNSFTIQQWTKSNENEDNAWSDRIKKKTHTHKVITRRCIRLPMSVYAWECVCCICVTQNMEYGVSVSLKIHRLLLLLTSKMQTIVHLPILQM